MEVSSFRQGAFPYSGYFLLFQLFRFLIFSVDFYRFEMDSHMGICAEVLLQFYFYMSSMLMRLIKRKKNPAYGRAFLSQSCFRCDGYAGYESLPLPLLHLQSSGFHLPQFLEDWHPSVLLQTASPVPRRP